MSGCMTSQQGTGDPCWNELPAYFATVSQPLGTASVIARDIRILDSDSLAPDLIHARHDDDTERRGKCFPSLTSLTSTY